MGWSGGRIDTILALEICARFFFDRSQQTHLFMADSRSLFTLYIVAQRCRHGDSVLFQLSFLQQPRRASMGSCASGAAGPRKGLSPLNEVRLTDTFMVIFLSPELADIGHDGPKQPEGGHHVPVRSFNLHAVPA